MQKNIAVGVIGAGPAGTATVGALLERGYTNIVWVDPHFLGGEFRLYWGIPANTRSAHLSFFANFLSVFSKHADSPEETADVFQQYELTETANLDELRLCLVRMTNIIRRHHSKEVKMVKDIVKQVVQSNTHLQLLFGSSPSEKIQRLFVCIGAVPKKMNILPGVPRLDLYDVMSPFAVEKYDLSNDIVDVFGSRNSGLLVLRNFMEMRRPPKLVRHYLNKELVYAEYIDDFIRHNFTGLKGAAYHFGKRYEQGLYKGRIITYQYDAKHLPEGATKVVEAIGFEPRMIQFVDKNNQKGYKLNKCLMYRQDGTQVQNIHFVGFVSPQIITDKEGQVMPAVGVNVFLEHSLAVIDQWEGTSKL